MVEMHNSSDGNSLSDFFDRSSFFMILLLLLILVTNIFPS